MVREKLQRLGSAVEWSRLRMQPFRERRMASIRHYLGAHYGESGDRMPLNMMELAIGIFKRQLAARNPGVIVRSRTRAMRPVAKKLELTVNKVMDEIDLSETFQRVVFDAIFGIGAVKIGVTEIDGGIGSLHDADLPFVDPVLMDDLVLDMRATSFEGMRFSGNRYILPFEIAKESKLFDMRGLSPNRPNPYNEQGDPRLQTIGTSGLMDEDSELVPTIELWDIWMPLDRKVMTFRSDDDGKIVTAKPLREVDWEGPERGPYEFLCLGELSGNLMPVPPVNTLVDLNDGINVVMRKLIRQSERQKTITMVAAGADEDGERILEAEDGDVIRVDRPEATAQASFGGVDQASLAFLIQMRDMFSYVSGNLDAMGGLSNSAETLGQEQLIQASASQKIRDYQSRMLSFAKRVTRQIATYVFYDPKTNYQIMLPLADNGIEVPLEFTPADREEADFIDLTFDVAPASMQDASNTQRIDTITKTVTQYLAPLMPAMQMQGLTIDVPSLMNHLSDLTNTTELKDLVIPASQAPEFATDQTGANMSKPSVTTRRYERINRPTGGTRSSRDNVMTQILSGGNPNQQQRDTLTRTPD
jgi:hypothetical protein